MFFLGDKVADAIGIDDWIEEVGGKHHDFRPETLTELKAEEEATNYIFFNKSEQYVLHLPPLVFQILKILFKFYLESK